MPTYSIRLTNSEFQSQDEPSDYPSLDEAIRGALGSAVDVARCMVSDKGEASVTIEACILEAEKVVARRIVTISAILPDDAGAPPTSD
ncbi:hypothetical protein [Sphingomonas sp.]|uniref:hypothetical protein n=1 Tax=Sphingomonas sp. TaxID=28214 RepID=UPI0025FF2630|nr:hypothetical protein [Sphingomonas sp.]MBV9527982.1 hypothetical protein [Sphingomonas sp.]